MFHTFNRGSLLLPQNMVVSTGASSAGRRYAPILNLVPCWKIPLPLACFHLFLEPHCRFSVETWMLGPEVQKKSGDVVAEGVVVRLEGT